MAEGGDFQFRALLAAAREDPDVLGVFLFGSREADEQQALFRDVERVAREHQFGPGIDEWKPDLEWLRGEAAYRA